MPNFSKRAKTFKDGVFLGIVLTITFTLITGIIVLNMLGILHSGG